MRAKVSEAIGLAMHDMGVDIATYVPGLGATDVYYDQGRKQRKRFALLWD